MGDSNHLPTQKINYFKVGEYLEAVRYIKPVQNDLTC